MNQLLEGLNPAQLEAVQTTEGPLLIIAGAGSGKTRALTSRVAHIIQSGLAEPSQVLAVTFTNKAALEMRERVQRMLGIDIKELNISTFHSFCARLLRREAASIGYPPGYVIYDTDDSRSLLKRCVEELGYSGAQFAPQALARRISTAKNSLQTADEFAQGASGYFESRTASVFQLYEKRLRSSGAMDFDDLILLSVRLLQDNETIRNSYRARFRYLMVDEYQDTNRSQYLLLKSLTNEQQNLCVVGDEDQSIYGWRGADIGNIRDFEKDFPGARVVILDQNYRSTQTILDAAGAVIANNSQRKEKHLRANFTGGDKIALWLTDNPDHEANLIVEDIVRRHDSLPLSEMVILYRTVAQSRALEGALIRRKVAYQIIGGVGFYQLKEIKDLIAYLKLIINFRDDVSFERAIKYPRRGFGDTSLGKLRTLATENGVSLYEVAQDESAISQLGPRAIKSLESFVALIKNFRRRAGAPEEQSVSPDAETSEMALSTSVEDQAPVPETIDTLMRDLIEEIAIEQEILKEAENESKGQTRIENIDEFISAALEFAKTASDPSLMSFLEEVALYTSFDSYTDTADKLTMMTIHAAKGLEFTAVYLSGLEEGLFPLMRAVEDPNELEEERRLFYVAVTRAKRFLTFSVAQTRFRYGSFESAPSRFIGETPEELMNKIDHRSIVRTADRRIEASGGRSLWSASQSASGSGAANSGVVYEYEEEEVMRPGRVVQHRVFGRGKVLGVEGRGEGMKLEVMFTGVGKKTLLAKYAKLKVVG